MTFQELQAIVTGEYNTTSKTLTINAADFAASPDVQSLFSGSLGGQPVVLTNAVQLSNDGSSSIVFQGTSAGIPSSISTLPATCNVKFVLVNGTAELILAYNLPPSSTGNVFKTYFPQLADTFFDGVQIAATPIPYFIFSSTDYTDTTVVSGQSIVLSSGINFYGGILPVGTAFDVLTLLFGTISSTVADGTVQPFSYGPTMDLDLAIPATLDQFFTALSLPVQLSLVSSFTADGTASRTGILASVSFDLGNEKGLVISSMLPFSGESWTTIAGDFTNVGLPAPGELINWIGGNGNDISSLLPTDISNGISLDSVSISITNTAPPTVAAVGFGMSAASGSGWNVIPGVLNVQNITADFNVYNPFNSATRKASLVINGTANFPSDSNPLVAFDIGASIPTGALSAAQSADTPIDLLQLIGTFIPSVTTVSEMNSFQLTGITLSADIGKTPIQYSFGGTVSGSFSFNFGGAENVAVASMNCRVGNTGTNGAMEGLIGGNASVLGMSLAANYNLNGDFMIDVKTPDFTVNLANVASELVGDNSVSTFTWLPTLTFSQTEFLVNHSSTSATTNELSLRTNLQIETLPTLNLFFDAIQYSGTWGFVAGIDVTLDGISSFPGLGSLKPFDDVFKLTEIGMVISSLTIGDYQFPGSENFTDPDLKTKSLTIPAGVGGVQAGVYAFAKADLSLNQNTNMMAEYLNIDAQLAISLFLGVNPMQNSKLTITLPSVTIDDSVTFSGSFGGGISGGEIMLFLTGTMTISGLGSLTNNQDLIFATTLVVVENGAFVSGTMQGVLNFDVIKLENLALEVGINFEGIPSLGVAASIYVPSLQNFNSSVAIFVDSAAPQKSMVAGSISDTTLDQVFQATIGQLVTIPPSLSGVLAEVFVKGDPTQSFTIPATLATDLDNQNLAPVATAFAQFGQVLPTSQQQSHLVVSTPGQAWFITTFLPNSAIKHYQLTLNGSVINVGYEAQFYLAPAATTIGTLAYPQGFFVSAQIGIFFIVLTATVTIDSSNGIAADGSIDKIVIWKPEFFSLTDSTGNVGPYLSLSTYTQASQPTPSLQSPHFLLSAKYQMLGLTDNIYVNISTSGLEINVQQTTAISQFSLNGTFNSLTDFLLSGSVMVGVNQQLDLGVLGSYHLQAQIGGATTISFQNGVASAKVSGVFAFMGTNLNFQIDLTVNMNGLGDILNLAVQTITNTLIDFFADAAQWVKAVGQNIIQGIENTGAAIGNVLNSYYHMAADAAGALLESLGYALDFIQDALNVFNNHGDVNMHIDNNYGSHIDSPGNPHQDSGGIHTDNAGNHSDMKNWDGSHGDSWAPPHLDSTTGHNDIAAINHQDQPSSHQDQASHADNGKPK